MLGGGEETSSLLFSEGGLGENVFSGGANIYKVSSDSLLRYSESIRAPGQGCRLSPSKESPPCPRPKAIQKTNND